MPPAVRLVLLIEFEYVKVYINSIVLQAMLGAANTATTFVEDDWEAIRTLTASCRTITQLIARGLQLEMLLHCSPARCYLRGLGATTFLLKACLPLFHQKFFSLIRTRHLRFQQVWMKLNQTWRFCFKVWSIHTLARADRIGQGSTFLASWKT